MIFNENVIRNNVLKNTLVEEISRVNHQIGYVPMVCSRIGQLTEDIAVEENVLKQLREKYILRQEKLQREKVALKQQLKAKIFYKMTQQQALSDQMKILQQNCHFIREKKQTLTEMRVKQNRLKNQLQELDVYDKETDIEIEKLGLKAIYDKKIEGEETENVKQLLMLIEAKGSEISKKNKLMAITIQQIKDKERKIVILKQQNHNIQVGIAQILPSLETLNLQTIKKENQAQKIKLNLSSISSKTSKLTYQVERNLIQIQNNRSKQAQLTKKISEFIEESNSLNQKLIKTREHVIILNTLKNNQKILNQQLKVKVRQLMKITIDHAQFSQKN